MEDLTEEELVTIKNFYIHLSELAEKDQELFTTHSIDEAKLNHSGKHQEHAGRHQAAEEAARDKQS